MSLHFVYSQPTTPAGAGWSIDLGTSVVRLGSIQGFIASAEAGNVPVSNIVLDDPGGNLDIVGLKQFRVTEDTAPTGSNIIWTGYIGRRTIKRGDRTQRPSLRVGADRQWDVELVDVNAILNFRVISGTDGKRPAETDIQRIDWVRSTVYLPLADSGLIDRSNPYMMDKADLRGRMAVDVLQECATATNKNYWAYYDRTTGSDSLAYLKASGSYGNYDSSMRLTTVLADVDGSVTFAALDDWQLVRDPTRTYAGVYLTYTGGAVYQYSYTTSYAFGFRDGIWPASHVTTLAGATALATHALDVSSTEDDRLTVRAKLPARHVNDALEGQRFQVNIPALPDYTGYNWWRILRRTVAQDETTDATYNVTYEAAPTVFNPCDPTNQYPAHSTGPLGGPGGPNAPFSNTDLMGPYYFSTGDGFDIPSIVSPSSAMHVNYPQFEWAMGGAYNGSWVDGLRGASDNAFWVYCQGDGTLDLYLAGDSGAVATIYQDDFPSVPLDFATIGSSQITLRATGSMAGPITKYSYNIASISTFTCYHLVRVEINGPFDNGSVYFDHFTWTPTP